MKKICIILAALLLCLAMTAYAETAEETDLSAILGVISGDTYENAFLGIGCTLEGWHYYTEEEIAATYQLTTEAMGEEYRKLLETSQAIQVMIATTPDRTQAVNIEMKNIPSFDTVVETYGLSSILASSRDAYIAQLEAAGLTDVDLTLGEVTIGDRVLPCYIGSYTMLNTHTYIRMLCMTSGDYMASITIAGASPDDTDPILASFYLLEQAEQPAA